MAAAEAELKGDSIAEESTVVRVTPANRSQKGPVQSRWMLGILDNACSQMKMLADVSDVAVKAKLPADALKLIEKQLEAEHRFQQAVEAREHEVRFFTTLKESEGVNSDEEETEERLNQMMVLKRELRRAELDLERNTKQLVRVMRRLERDPSSTKGLPGSAADFLHQFDVFRRLMQQELMLTSEEQHEIETTIQDLTAKRTEMEALVESWTRRLETQRMDNDTALRNYDKKIERLQRQIRELKSQDKESCVQFHSLFEEQKSEAEREFQQKEKELLSELQQLHQKFMESCDEHGAQEVMMHRKKVAKEKDLDTLISNYDEKMTKLQAEKEEVQTKFVEERKERVRLESHFLAVDEQNQIEEDQRTRERARLAQLAEQERRRMQTAYFLQIMFEHYKVAAEKLKGKTAGKGRKRLGRTVRSAPARRAGRR